MKKLYYLLITLMGVCMVACGNDDGVDNSQPKPEVPEPDKITLSQQTIEVGFEPDTYSINVTSPYSWDAVSKNDWIIVDSPTGIAGTEQLAFSIARNEDEKVRKGTIVVTNSDYNLITEFYITQAAFVPEISIAPKTLNFSIDGGKESIAVTANFKHKATTDADWLTITKNKDGYTIKASANPELEERTAEVVISNEKYNISKIIQITQEKSNKKQLIYYTSINSSVVTPYKLSAFGANIISNTYKNGIGVIVFDGEVATIGNYAFRGCSSLTSVTIPDSVTSIGHGAFYYCSSLTSVTIPDSVTSIGQSAFNDCSSLTSITIGSSVTTIGGSAFCGCSSLTSVYIRDLSAWCRISFETSEENPLFYAKNLYLNNELVTDLDIPNDITEIKSYAFYNCSSLTSVTIPDSVTTIGREAFYDCSSLTSVTIGDGVTSIGSSAFSGCTGELIINSKIVETDYSNSNYPSYSSSGWLSGSKFSSLTIGDNIEKIGSYTFYYCSSLTSVTIGDGVTTIGWGAFYDCSSLTSVTIGDSVTTIGVNAFEDCSSLTSVTIPDSVTSIGHGAFNDCSSLTNVTIPDSVTEIGDYAFNDCSSLTSITIPDSVTTIGDSTFSGCSSLTSVTIPDSVTKIGYYAFSGCSSLTSVTIPDSVTTIGYYAFRGCSSLTSVAIPDSVTSIGDYAFEGCTGELIVNCNIPDGYYDSYDQEYVGVFSDSKFTSVTIGDSVTKIGKYAFYNCSSLTSVYCKAVTPPAGDYKMFYKNASGRRIYVPTESVNAYKSASGWKDYADAIVGYDF